MVEPYQALGLVPTMPASATAARSRRTSSTCPPIKAASRLSSLDLPVRSLPLRKAACRASTTRSSTWTTRRSRASGHRASRPRDRRPARWPVSGTIPDGPGQSPSSGVPWPLLQRRLHPQSRSPGDPPPRQGGPAAAGRASGHPAQRLGPVDRAIRPNLDDFYPLPDTEIGRLGFLMANEGCTPRTPRLAMNGAEVVTGVRPAPAGSLYEIHNRARALEKTST